MFGCDELNPLCSPQHAVSVVPSSNVIRISPPSLYACDAMITGTQDARNLSICRSPPGWPVTQGTSCPSSHRFGDIHEKAGVLPAAARSPRSGLNDSTCAAQYLASPVTERKYMNPSCRTAYWSVAVAPCVWSIPQVAGCPHAGPRGVATVRSRAGLFPMSCMYAAQDSFAAVSWLPSVGTDLGKTHPPSGASTWW